MNDESQNQLPFDAYSPVSVCAGLSQTGRVRMHVRMRHLKCCMSRIMWHVVLTCGMLYLVGRSVCGHVLPLGFFNYIATCCKHAMLQHVRTLQNAVMLARVRVKRFSRRCTVPPEAHVSPAASGIARTQLVRR